MTGYSGKPASKQEAFAFAARMRSTSEEAVTPGGRTSFNIQYPNGTDAASLLVTLVQILNNMLAGAAKGMGLTYDELVAKLLDDFEGQGDGS